MDYLYNRLTDILCTLQEQDPNWQQRVGNVLTSAGFDMQQVQPTGQSPTKESPTGEPATAYAARIVADFRR